MCPMHTARSHTQTATHHVPPYPTAHVTVHGTLARAVATAFAPVTCHEPAPSSQGVLRTSPSSPARDTLATSKDTCPAPSSPLPPSRRHGALILSRLPRSPISDVHTSLPRLPCLRYTQATLSWSHTPLPRRTPSRADTPSTAALSLHSHSHHSNEHPHLSPWANLRAPAI